MPAPAVPADAITTVSRTGARAVVRFIVENPDCYFGDISDATEAPVSSLTRDLRLLENIGVVTTDSSAPQGQRRGRSPRYRVDAERVDELLADLRAQLLG